MPTPQHPLDDVRTDAERDLASERPSRALLLAVVVLALATAATVAWGWPRVSDMQHGVEAMEFLGRVARGASVYYVKPRGGEGGERMPCQFPQLHARSVAAASCCDPSVNLPGTAMCDPAKVAWQRSPWSDLGVALDRPQPFVWEWRGSGTFGDARYEISAYGDLDCDGVASTFRFVGVGDAAATPSNCVLHTRPQLQVIDPQE